MSDNIEGDSNRQPPSHPSTTYTDVTARTARANSGEEMTPPVPNQLENYEMEDRYEVTVLVLASLMLATCFLHAMATSSNRLLHVTSFLGTLFLAFYGYQWVIYFSDGLTRRKRAFFDVRNMLLTYQPNKNTDKSRLFQPDPPTPNVSILPPPTNGQHGQKIPLKTAENNKEFLDWRNQYYKNEYTIAMETISDQKRAPLYKPNGADAEDDHQDEIANEKTPPDSDMPDEPSTTKEEEQPAPAADTMDAMKTTKEDGNGGEQESTPPAEDHNV